MDVVLDTNVLIAAMISPKGAPARIMQVWMQGGFTLVMSVHLERELRDVMRRPRVRKYVHWQDEEIDAFVDSLLLSSRFVAAEDFPAPGSRDPADNPVLAAAVAGGVQCLVTGDRDLLELAPAGDTEIVTPAKFLSLVEEPPE